MIGVLTSASCAHAFRKSKPPNVRMIQKSSALSRRTFVESIALAGFLHPLIAVASAPSGVLGDWTFEQKGLPVAETGVLTFQKSGEVTLAADKDIFFSISDWKVEKKEVAFNIEYEKDVLAYKGVIDDDGSIISGSVAVLSQDSKPVGSFSAKLARADSFVKKRGAFTPFVPDGPAVVREGIGYRRSAFTTNPQVSSQAGAYLQFNPADLKDTLGYR